MGVPDSTPPEQQSYDQQPPVPVQSLDYRLVPPDTRRRNRVVLVLLIGGALLAVPLLLVLVFVARSSVSAPRVVVATPVPTMTARDYELQRREQAFEQYLAHMSPPGVVVYDEDAARTAKLLTARPQKYRETSTGSVDAKWASSFDRPVVEISPRDIPSVPPFVHSFNQAEPDKAVLFVGRLHSPAGNPRLVFLNMKINISGRGGRAGESEHEVQFGRTLEYRIYDASAVNGLPNQLRHGTSLAVKTPTDAVPIRWIDGSLRGDRRPNGTLQMFAGTLDANDPSHCTVGYDYGGQRGTIDVYLTDDDFLRVLPRSGRVAGGRWDVVAATPATGEVVERPTTQPAP